MKFTKLTHLVVLALALTIAGSGCRKGPQKTTVLPNPYAGNKIPTDLENGGPIGDGKTGGTRVGSDPLNEGGNAQGNAEKYANWPRDREIFKAYTVHFAYDSSVVKTSDAANVRSVADHLKANAMQAVLIEGHCDERGTEEYNRALGERRALAIRDELIKLGIQGDRVNTISFGKDQPADTGSGDAAHAKNRRGEFILLKPPGPAA